MTSGLLPRITLLLAACAGWLPAPGLAEKPIVIINPYPPSGPAELAGSSATNKALKIMQTFAAPSVTDVLAERVGQSMGVALDRIVTIERRSRGRSIVGARYVAESAPDGHTLLLSSSVKMVTYPRLYPLPYDPLRDFIPVAPVARMPVVVIAPAGGAVHSLRGLIEAAQGAPGKFNYGSAGDFTSSHLAAELFKTKTGTRLVHVNYNGGMEAVNGVAKGQVHVAFVPLPAVLPFASSDRFRLLAIADAARHEVLPTVPTVAEHGLPDFEAATWFGIFAPRGTPGGVVAQLNEAIAKGLRSQQSMRLLFSQGLQGRHLSSTQFARLIHAEHAKWRPVINALKPPY